MKIPWYSRLLKYVSQLLNAIWIFFPGIIFLILPIFCFWMLGQGKDIIVAFIDNPSTNKYFNYNRVVFFLIIGFWVYISWYSSRIISYIKKNQQVQSLKDLPGTDIKTLENEFESNKPIFEIGKPFLDEFPRIIGNACFLILELAVLQSPILYKSLPILYAWILFFLFLIILLYINKWIDKRLGRYVDNPTEKFIARSASFRRTFWILFWILIAYVLTLSFLPEINIITLFFLLLFFHIVFIYYINLRIIELANKAVAAPQKDTSVILSWLDRSMNFFCIPYKEKGYYKWYLIAGAAGIIIYFINVISLDFARNIGPFPGVILGFAMLLAFGNLVTAFSVRLKVNFHFILFLLAFLISGVHQTHKVRTKQVNGGDNKYADRPSLKKYLETWLTERNVLVDSNKNGYDVYFVMANGGASRSGYWTASVLDSIEDASLARDTSFGDKSRFSDHVFCLSGTSGGGVGVATFFSLLKDKQQNTDPHYTRSAKDFLKQDYFTYTFARMLGPDFFNYIIPYSSKSDRAAALERSFEISAKNNNKTFYKVPFFDNFSTFPALVNERINLPILFVNTTRIQDGNPGVVTNLQIDSATFNNRVDVVKLLDKPDDISITSASILGARFPYLSPAGGINNNYFVDGGYFDNSGAGVVQEIIRGIINIGKRDSIDNGGNNSKLYQQIRKLHFKVLHITNSPIIFDSAHFTSVAPLKNDLMAPILAIIGAYDMQTTVNDGRLINFIKDIDSFTINKADYIQIPLYKDAGEWEHDELRTRFPEGEPPYAMNWFISDTTRNRIDDRLSHHKVLNDFIQGMNAVRVREK